MGFESEAKAVQKRGLLKRSLTQLENYLKQDNINHHELISRQNRLPEIWKEFSNVREYLECVLDTKSSETHFGEHDEFENRYHTIFGRIQELLCSFERPTSPTNASIVSDNSTRSNSRLKLPPIELPVFKGDLTKYLSFRNTFESLVINNTSIDNVQRLHYLLSSLQGEPKDLLDNLAICADNFNIAWNLIDKRYNNKRLIVSQHVKHLLNLHNCSSGSAFEYRKLINQVSSNLSAIDSLESQVALHEILLQELILNKIKSNHRAEWENKFASNNIPTLYNLIDFLERKCQTLELTETKKPGIEQKREPKSNLKALHITNNSTSLSCRFCKIDNHSISDCRKFKRASIDHRRRFVREGKLCYLCFSASHVSKQCTQQKCPKCNGPHNLLVHKEEATSNNNTNVTGSAIVSSTAMKVVSGLGSNVLLSTACVGVKTSLGEIVVVKALLDSASQLSFVTSSVVKRLGIRTKACRLPIVGIGDANVSPVSSTCNLVLFSNVSDYTLKLNCAVVNTITSPLPAQQIDCSNWVIPSDVILSDRTFNQPSTIDILLGADVYYEIVSSNILHKKGHPTLLDTKFGWVLSGTFPKSCIKNDAKARRANLVKLDSLDTKLQRFWELEELRLPVLTPEERACEEHFVNNVQRDDCGRFVVKLPIRPEASPVAESKHTAVKRLKQIEHKFARFPDLKRKYVDFMREYNEMGHMEIVPSDTSTSLSFYMPHHCVLKDSSTTTKLRVVFDGSCESSNGIALNSMLMVGPTIQPDLLSIVLRFRTYFVALSSDIAKMYRCVLIHPDHRNLQKIVWRDSSDEEIKDYRLTTVTYGTSSAPFLATRCLVQLADEHQESHPIASEIIRSCFYVDDLLTGTSSVEEAKELQSEISSVLESAHFHLRKWVSNCPEALVNVPVEDREALSPCNLTKDEAIKTLGIVWYPNCDEFQFQINLKKAPKEVTKRSILTIIASIFDPLGLLGCAVIKCKLVLQSLWQLKVNWDDPLEPLSETVEIWNAIYRELPLLNELRVPRNAMPFAKNKVIEVHGFSDASEAAYGACVYVRTVSENDEVSVILLTSKSRVAPLKQQSIARLELCAALLLSRLMSKVSESLKLPVPFHTYCWTDSTIVLCWLQKPSNCWKTFVANRIAEIQSLVSVSDWRHVSTHSNPADLLSRGVLPSQMFSLDVWWHGPTWLQELSPVYSDFVASSTPSAVNAESKSSLRVLLVKVHSPELERFSSFLKLKRVYSYMLRFISNVRSTQDTRLRGPLTVEELKVSEMKIISLIQASEYGKELYDLKSNNAVASSSALKSLNPFLDDDGLLRVGGRLMNSQLEHNEKHPIILPPKHFVTRLIIKYEHELLLHSGPQAVLYSLRSRFWIPRGKTVIRSVIHSCYKCFRSKPPLTTHMMGQLPSYRVEPSLPFVKVGLDYGGPIIIKGDNLRSKIKFKAYIALFVCLVTKAIHLEVVKSLTTRDFFAAFRRFTARRGFPSLILSDNGTNFVGANNELLRFLKVSCSEVEEYSSNLSVKWKFIPPSSPHFGGLWEAGIKSAKSLLKRTVGNSILNFEELSTLLCQIESVLNSRPICSMTEDPDDQCYLTPGHFLVGRRLTAVPSPNISNSSYSCLTRWNLVQQLYEVFWKKWSKEYIQSLQQRRKWWSTGKWIPSVGDLVLLREDNLPPLVWRTGVIQELHPGCDNITRVVTVKTKTGSFRRAIVKVCPLPKDCV